MKARDIHNTFDWLSRSVAIISVLFCTAAIPGQSQQTANEVWPELDTYFKLSQSYRAFLMASRATDRDSGNNAWEVGPNLDITLKPIVRMKMRSLDPERQKYLVFRIGYRNLGENGSPNENRIVLEMTPRFQLPKSVLVSDRNRIDLRWKGGFSWRYRNRIGAEKEFQIKSVTMVPYVRTEATYDFTAAQWSRVSVSSGVVFPFGRRVELEPSYERQRILSSPESYVNGVGLTLSLYF